MTCPYCKTVVDVREVGKIRTKYYVVCTDKDCMVNPCTELFEHREDAIKAWQQSETTIIKDSVLQEIYAAVEQCEDKRNKLSSDIARVKAENETYHFILDVLGIRRK